MPKARKPKQVTKPKKNTNPLTLATPILVPTVSGNTLVYTGNSIAGQTIPLTSSGASGSWSTIISTPGPTISATIAPLKMKNKTYTIKLPRGFNGQRCKFTVSDSNNQNYPGATVYSGIINGWPVMLVKQAKSRSIQRNRWIAFAPEALLDYLSGYHAPVQFPATGEVLEGYDTYATMHQAVTELAKKILNKGLGPNVTTLKQNQPTVQHLRRPNAPWKL